ncbi:hypothetical protein Tco_0724866 [Tanacetum coccineum]|uniref:Uncharacterized protein n=1 Tax=Tanacetum coccineum TaxID=301880 RepID=A0ABQ4YBA4_9ASTR
MAMVVRGHGRDNAVVPDDDRPWEPPSIHKNAKGRKKGSDAALIKKFEDGEKKKLPIKFNFNDLRTAKPIRPNRRHFTGLIGNKIERSVPFCYESWEALPDKYMGTLWPAIHTYFDMKTHSSGPNAKQVEKGMEAHSKHFLRALFLFPHAPSASLPFGRFLVFAILEDLLPIEQRGCRSIGSTGDALCVVRERVIRSSGGRRYSLQLERRSSTDIPFIGKNFSFVILYCCIRDLRIIATA